MFENPNQPSTGNSFYTNPSDIAEQNSLHTGLLVYNINRCSPFGKGLYVWDGIEWKAVSNLSLNPSTTELLASIPNVIHIPSGYDKRLYSAVGFNLDYDPTLFNGNFSWGNWINTKESGLLFGDAGTTLQPGDFTNLGAGGNWTTSPAVFSILPNKLPSSAITISKPWYTKESTITFGIPDGECNDSPTSKTVTLNQTNYAMAVKETNNESANPLGFYTIRGYPSSKNVFLQGNTQWVLTPTINDANVPLSSIIQNIDTYSGGTQNSEGGYTATPITITAASGNVNSKGTYASLVFSDPSGKANDVIVNVTQCLGSLNTSGSNIIDADPLETSQPVNNWGTAIVRHKTKTNVYNTFYSADFGSAGRWMITNLAASAYDGITVSPNISANSVASFTTPYYVYPQQNEGDLLTNSTYYSQHPEYGYLYNYSAASGKNSALKPQGICPQGWHLPTDTEWVELRTAILADPTRYALDNTSSAAAAMINPCETFFGSAQGLSKPVSGGGFNIFLMGYVFDLIDGRGIDMQEIGNASVFWTSTIVNTNNTKTFVYDYETNVQPLEYGKDSFLSIRCKKN